MYYEIEFIKWKNLITKSVDDLTLTGWFSCWIDLYSKLHLQLNKALTIKLEADNWESIELKCNINTETKNYIWFVEDHWVFKLDILFPDILLSGYLFTSKLKINID